MVQLVDTLKNYEICFADKKGASKIDKIVKIHTQIKNCLTVKQIRKC